MTFAIGVTLALSSAKDWDFSIWNNNDSSGKWAGTPIHFPFPALELLLTNVSRLQLDHISNDERSFFRGHIKRAEDDLSTFQFTVRYRKRDVPWQWVQDECGLGNGEVIFKPSMDLHPDMDYYLGSPTDADLSVHSIRSHLKSCACWEIHTSVPAARGSQSGLERATIGAPGKFLRWFALVRHNEHWFSPRQGRSRIELDKEAILLSFLLANGQHIVLVAVSGFDGMTSLFSADAAGRIVLVSRNDGK